MTTSVNNYARYLNHPQRWALGRFVLPVARLDEFMSARETSVPEPWHLSGIVSANDWLTDLAEVDDFNRKASGARDRFSRGARLHLEEIELVREHRPPGTAVFYEIAPEQADELLPMLRAHWRLRQAAYGWSGGGGVSLASSRLARFIARCAELGVPFKATAGLHHPLRCMRPLTYDARLAPGQRCTDF